MKITLDLPDQYTIYFNQEEIQKEIKLNNALMLYKKHRISLSKAAEFANLPIYDFMHECKENEIPVIDYTEEELAKELDMAKKVM